MATKTTDQLIITPTKAQLERIHYLYFGCSFVHKAEKGVYKLNKSNLYDFAGSRDIRLLVKNFCKIQDDHAIELAMAYTGIDGWRKVERIINVSKPFTAINHISKGRVLIYDNGEIFWEYYDSAEYEVQNKIGVVNLAMLQMGYAASLYLDDVVGRVTVFELKNVAIDYFDHKTIDKYCKYGRT